MIASRKICIVRPASGKCDAAGWQFVIVEAVGDIERNAVFISQHCRRKTSSALS